MYCFHSLTLKIHNSRGTFKLRVRAESSVITRFYRVKLQVEHSFKYSELSRHRQGSIHLKYVELIGICWTGDGEWPFISITWKLFEYCLVLPKKEKTQICNIHYICIKNQLLPFSPSSSGKSSCTSLALEHMSVQPLYLHWPWEFVLVLSCTGMFRTLRHYTKACTVQGIKPTRQFWSTAM